MAAADDFFSIHHHGTTVDGKKGRVQCNYCCKSMSGFSRLKCHLAGVRGDVTPCEGVPENVKESWRNKLLETKGGSPSKKAGELCHPYLPCKRNGCFNSNDGVKHFKSEATEGAGYDSGSYTDTESEQEGVKQHILLLNGRIDSQPSINFEKKKDSLSWQAQKCIGRFFYETGIDFSVANSPSFHDMINATIGRAKEKYEIPSCQELKGWILHEEVREVQEYVMRIRHSWESTGCSILLDAWTDEKGRNLVSFIVDCPQGPIYLRSLDISASIGDVDGLQLLLDGIIEEVGIYNVVQIVACSMSGWMEDVGRQFMERRRTVFWTMSAFDCIELMLEKIGMIDSARGILEKAKTITRFIHGHATVLKLFRDFTGTCNLIKPSKFRSAMPFMTLENIVAEKKNMKAMFASSNWNTTKWASRTEGKRIVKLVEDCSFWSTARMVLKAAIPLVRVLCLINGADTPQVGYIYETMDQAKEAIKEEFKNMKTRYLPIWEIIDEIWNNHLHSPLHAAGYYLNPSLFYSSDFYSDPEVSFGLLCCIVRMVQDQRTQDMISVQLDEYRHGNGAFREGSASDQRNKYSPAEWWSHYGGQYPELQRFAIRILSQTCDGASKYSFRRRLCEKLLTNGRNPIEQQRLSDLTFVHYNLQLQKSRQVFKCDIVADEIDPRDEWIVDGSPENETENGDSAWVELISTERVSNVEGIFPCQTREK